jgi:hypothetical protein
MAKRPGAGDRHPGKTDGLGTEVADAAVREMARQGLLAK